MSAKDKDSLNGLIAAGAAGTIFLAFWLGIGVPLPFSAGSAVAAYAASWFMLKARKPKKEGGYLDAPVDKKLAADTVARGRAAALRLRELSRGLNAKHPCAPRFKKIAELLEAIAADVEADPKDAPAAAAFLGTHAETAAKLARLAVEVENRGASKEQLDGSRARLDKALGLLQEAYERHLARLQEDNLAELDVELEVLEQSLGFDKDFDDELNAGHPPPGTGRRNGK